MSNNTVKTRFAPSPTGQLHLGNVRTALFSALHARHAGGRFLLRIEDTDKARSREAFTRWIEDDLRWLGLTWDEGLDAGGDAGPYVQSAREPIYADLYARLQAAGRAYPCFCTQEQLEASRAAQRAAGRPPRYAGTCARLSAEEAAARVLAGEPHTLRFRVPAGETIEFEDLVRGPQCFSSDDIGDFVIRRTDGTPAFFFCNAVDDALMGVTHVWRGEDHLSNTSRQLLILRALGLPEPRYGHLALIVGEDGAPLSKRHGAMSLEELRERGYLPAAVTNYLARLGHTYASDALLNLDALAAAFDPVRLGRSAARFDLAQLDHWQKRALAAATPAQLVKWAGGSLTAVPVAQRERFMATVRDNVLFPADVLVWAQSVYEKIVPDEPAEAAIKDAPRELFTTALELLSAHGDDFRAWTKAISVRTGLKGRALFMPLRAALTGRAHGPEMAHFFALLGREKIEQRLRAVMEE